MTESETEMLLSNARETLRNRFGHSDFRVGQEAVVRDALTGRNLLVVMPTGSGKSLLYQLPALLSDGLTLVISPLIALMKDQVDELTRRGVPATFINSSLDLSEQRKRLDACRSGKIKLLYVAPERFQSGPFVSMLGEARVARLAVDEAHCISEWGHDFRPDYRRLKQFREKMGLPFVTALTATATPRVQEDIIESLGLRRDEVQVHVSGFDRPNLALEIVHERDNDRKMEELRGILRRESGTGIIYVGTRKKTEEIAAALRDIEPGTVTYHAGLEPQQRARAQEQFLTGKARVAVATIAFGMGIDKRDVRFVVHVNYPASVEQYYQEIGRAGRDGQPSRCTLLYSPEDRFLREFFIDLNYPTPEMVETVYDLLWSLPENPIQRTYANLAQICGLKEGNVGAAVRLLDGAGVTQAMNSEMEAAVNIDRPGAQILPGIRGQMRRRVFEALSVSFDLEQPGRYLVRLHELAEAAGLGEEQVRRALAALHQDNMIRYEPPFHGRGIRKVTNPPPAFDEVGINWARQQALRRMEEEKLERMEEYIRCRSCRRSFILKYFGENRPLKCGACDNCSKSGTTGPDVLEQQRAIAQAILTAVMHVPFRVGTGFIAEILAGSKSKRMLKHRQASNPAYGAARVDHKLILAVIDRLLAQGYLQQDGVQGRPVLFLTEAGEAAVPESLPHTATLGNGPAQEADAQSIEHAVVACVGTLRPAMGASRVAAIVTGSKAAWIGRSGADGLPCYGVCNVTQERARDVINDMLRRRLLARTRDGEYPVLTLGPAAAGKTFEAPKPPPEPEEKPPQLQPEPPQPQDAPNRAERLLEVLLDELLASDRQGALQRVEELRLFSPVRVVPLLMKRFERESDQAMLSRIVWVAGEAGGSEAIPLLTRAVESEHVNVRRLAASAACKLAQTGLPAPDAAALQAAIAPLLKDSSPQVRQYAEKALACLRKIQ